MEKITYTKAHRAIIEFVGIDKWRESRIDVSYPSEDTLSKINDVLVSRKTFKSFYDNNLIRVGVGFNKKYKFKGMFTLLVDVIKIEGGKVFGTGFSGGRNEHDVWVDREDIETIWLNGKDADKLLSMLEHVTVRDLLDDKHVKSGMVKISFDPPT